MSVIFSNSDGWVVCHRSFVRTLYRQVTSPANPVKMCYPENLFKIAVPFVRDGQAVKMYKRLVSENPDENSGNLSRTRKRKCNHNEVDDECMKEVLLIKSRMNSLITGAVKLNHFNGKCTPQDVLANNKLARDEAGKYHQSLCCNSHDCIGGNNKVYPIQVKIQDAFYMLPPMCSFYQCGIDVACDKLSGKKFDFILLDPPWKNKFVRRKKMKRLELGYKMMGDEELEHLPISMLLNDSGLIAVWTTNAQSHIETLKEKIFPIWGVVYVSTWFWIKVTQFGEEVTPLLNTVGKQPYERIIFGSRKNRSIPSPEDNKCIISVPSAIHSHKPPLTEILHSYLPENPACLELFARYLLPGWTSCGDQVLSLQLSSLFQEIK